MIVADTSAWVEVLRDTNHPSGRTLDHLLASGADVAMTEVVFMELLAGGRRDNLREIRSRLASLPMIPLRGLADYENAASVHRVCRESGEPVRSLADCLIAVAAMRAGASVLHNDRDFEKMARHAGLRIEPYRL